MVCVLVVKISHAINIFSSTYLEIMEVNTFDQYGFTPSLWKVYSNKKQTLKNIYIPELVLIK